MELFCTESATKQKQPGSSRSGLFALRVIITYIEITFSKTHLIDRGRYDMIKISDNRIIIETKTVIAEMIDGRLVNLKSRKSGRTYIEDPDYMTRMPLQLVYSGNTRVELDPNCLNSSMEYLQYGDHRVDICLDTWNGSGILSVSEDLETGDVIFEPSAFSSMPGVRAVRWDISGLRHDAKMIAPLYQGVMVNMDDPMIRNSRFIYPYKWEAGFVAFHSENGGVWIHTEDTPYHFRTLNIGDGENPYRIGLETEVCGPVTDNLSAGSCAWRVNVYEGDWTVPVKQYKEYIWERLNLEERRRNMPDWMNEIRLAYSWCPTDRRVLTELKRYIDPGKVLIHLPSWRCKGYDMDYPNYAPSDAAVAFIKEASEMGYHVAPHVNAYEIDPTRKEFELVRDFRFRDIETRRGMGWAFYYGCIPLPENNTNLTSSQQFNVMTKIHPGHAMWRYLLSKGVSEALEKTGTDTIFVDTTHNVFNLDNEHVNDLTCGEGIVKLLHGIEQLQANLCVGGEGLNEVVVSGQYYAQGHLFVPHNGADASTVTAEKLCPVNKLLYDGVCKIIGYHSHEGDRAAMKRTYELDSARGFVPTLIRLGHNDLSEPDEVVREILEAALV